MKEVEMLDPNDLVIVGLDTEDGEEHPLYDHRARVPVNPALVKNVMVYGVLQPVLVRQEAGVMYVVDGRQRVKAAREAAKLQSEAGEHTVMVPARVLRGQDDMRVSGIMVSSNEHRLDDNVMAKAKKASHLLSLIGDLNAVALAFGRSPTTIRNWLSLLEADPEVQQAVGCGDISAAVAIELAALPREKQKETLGRLLRRGQFKVVSGDEETPSTEGVPVEKVPEAPLPEEPKAERPSQVIARRVKAESGYTKRQKGLRRTWLRKSLKTEAAKGLAQDQLDVLRCFAYGEIDEESWIGKFIVEASAEIGPPED